MTEKLNGLKVQLMGIEAGLAEAMSSKHSKHFRTLVHFAVVECILHSDCFFFLFIDGLVHGLVD
jgi:hypothetical protein